jgi:integrase
LAANLERATLAQYRQHLDLHIVPFLGRAKLSQMSVAAVRGFQDRLRSEGRSAAMVRRVTVSLGSLIADAQERGHVSHNAVREMAKRRGKGRARQGERRRKGKLQVGVDIPTPAEVRAIIENAKSRWRPLLVTAIFTGLRASELRGLRWSDVDLKEGRIYVRQRADRYHEIGMPKSDASQRSVPVGAMVINTLKEWKLACPKSELDLVFPTGKGQIEWLPNIIRRGFIPAQIAAGVTIKTKELDDKGRPIVAAKYTGLHSLRHFYASWCINRVEDGGLGLPPKMVQERLGHSSITMTMDVYGHLFPTSDDAEALAKAERRLLFGAHAT